MRTSEKWSGDASKAFVGAIAAMPRTVAMDATNPHFRSKYATIQAVSKAVLPVFAEHGFAPVVSVELTDEGHDVARLSLLHESGEWLRVDLPWNPSKPDPQGAGSALTYARRYLLGMVSGIAADEDDDGNAGSKRNDTPPPPKKKPKPTPTAHPLPSLSLTQHQLAKHIPLDEWEDVAGTWHQGARIPAGDRKLLFKLAAGNGWEAEDVAEILKHHLGIKSTADIPNGDPFGELCNIFTEYEKESK